MPSTVNTFDQNPALARTAADQRASLGHNLARMLRACLPAVRSHRAARRSLAAGYRLMAWTARREGDLVGAAGHRACSDALRKTHGA